MHWLKRIRETWLAFGLRATGLFLLDRVLTLLVGLDVQTIVWLEDKNARACPAHAPGFQFRFLSADEVESLAEAPEHHLTADFADRIRRGHDFCYGAFSPDGRLASYGWYALGEVEAEHSAGAAMQLPDSVAYMYKGYTHPDFRGARLHGAGMGGALQALGAHGVHSLISMVHWANFASLRSCKRLGYTTLGSISAWGLGARRHQHVPSPADAHGVRMGAYCLAREPVEV